MSSVHSNQEENLLTLLKVRLAVAALGERASWWKTTCCSPDRFPIFKQLFPRTWRQSSFNTVSEAAKLVHREGLTNRAQHLFRFESEMEQDLRDLLGKPEGEALFDSLFSDLANPLDYLESVADQNIEIHPGALSLGEASRDNICASLPKIAACYLKAFNNHYQSYPFFEPRD